VNTFTQGPYFLGRQAVALCQNLLSKPLSRQKELLKASTREEYFHAGGSFDGLSTPDRLATGIPELDVSASGDMFK